MLYNIFFISLQRNNFLVMNLIPQKLLNFFKKKNNPCFFIHINHLNGKILPHSLVYLKDIKKIFFDPRLNKKEYCNENQTEIPDINTVYQGKRFFYRFLKENNFFSQYLYYHAILKLNVNATIRKEFAKPFYSIMYEIVTRSDGKNIEKYVLKDLRKMDSLSKKWNNILKSICYRV